MGKKAVLQSVLRYFGRCSTPTRLRWGRWLGRLAPMLLRSRTHIVRTNLQLCFPDLSAAERQAMLHRHFHLLAQSFVDRGLCWYGDAQKVLDTVQLHGSHHLDALLQDNRRVLMLAPHFVGLDAAATRLTLFLQESATLYTRQSDPAVDQIMRQGRARFNTVHMVERRAGVRGLIRHLRNGIPVYYLPDMDFGRQGSAFLPFFGIPAATLLSTAQIAERCQAVVVPIICRLDTDTGQYHVQIGPPLDDFPGTDDAVAATARINRLIETEVRTDPAQYYWVHRRFKTRPRGEPKLY